MTQSKRDMLSTVLVVAFGHNTGTVRRAIRGNEHIPMLGGSAEQMKRNAANIIASRCSSYQQALKFVEEWAK